MRKVDYRVDQKKYRVRSYQFGRETHHGLFDTLREAQVCQHGHHWLDGESPEPEKNFGFVYQVTDRLTGKKYIGSKQYWFFAGECENTPNDVTDPRFDPDCWIPSDWDVYCSSSDIVAPIITERPEDFKLEILEQYPSKITMFLGEIEYQMASDVLNAEHPDGGRLFWNQHIAGCDYNIIPDHKRELQYRQKEVTLGSGTPT